MKSYDDNDNSLKVYSTVCFKPFHTYYCEIALGSQPKVYHHLHFIAEEIKFYIGEVTHPKSAGKILQKLDSLP